MCCFFFFLWQWVWRRRKRRTEGQGIRLNRRMEEKVADIGIQEDGKGANENGWIYYEGTAVICSEFFTEHLILSLLFSESAAVHRTRSSLSSRRREPPPSPS